MKNIKAESPGLSSELGFGSNHHSFKKAPNANRPAGSTEENVDPTQIAFARAQRVDVSGKIDASIK
jgi:hypothetical protein